LIHQYINNGFYIVLDVNSGSVHVVDKITYDMIALIVENHLEWADKDCIQTALMKDAMFAKEKVAVEEFHEILEEILTLRESGQLFSEDIYEKSMEAFQNRQTVVKALCLHIAHDCNLKCRYCFAEEGEYHGRRALMSFEVGKKALDFLVVNSGSRVNLEVDFFGGEPLMNWQVVKDLVAYGRSLEEPHHKKFRFTLTTNGVLLDQDILDFVADYVKSERIGMLEQMSTESILHLKSKFQVEVYNMGEKYRLIKDLDNEETWEFDKGNTILKEGIICIIQNNSFFHVK